MLFVRKRTHSKPVVLVVLRYFFVNKVDNSYFKYVFCNNVQDIIVLMLKLSNFHLLTLLRSEMKLNCPVFLLRNASNMKETIIEITASINFQQHR